MQELWLYLLGVIILLLGLAVSIGLHEVGHLLPAKLFKVKVLRYMVGFGPTVWSTKKGETEYGIKAIPLGGYVAMIGMYPPKNELDAKKPKNFLSRLIADARQASNEDVRAEDEARTFYRLPVFKKIIVMLGGPLMNLFLALLFMGVVVSGFGVQQASTRVEIVSECLVPAGSEITECEASLPPAPAAKAGLQPGDEILAIDGVQIHSWQDIPAIVSQSFEVPLGFEVLRDGERLNITVTPAANERYIFDEFDRIKTDESGHALTEKVGMIGVSPAIENVRLPISAAPEFVYDNIKAVANIILNMPERLVAVWNAAFGPSERELDSPLSVVGVGRIAGEVFSTDSLLLDKVRTMFGLLASLNVALFVFNLVPLLPLDGGHILGALYEGLKRSIWKLFGKKDPGPVDTAKMVPFTLVIAAVLIGMTVLLVYADLVKPISFF